MREGVKLGVDKTRLKLLVETASEWAAPVSVIGPRDGAEVGHALSDLLYGDMGLSVGADSVE